MIARRREAYVEEAFVDLPLEDGEGPESVRPTLGLFEKTGKAQRQLDQHWGCLKRRERPNVS